VKVYSDAGLLDLLGRIAEKHDLPTHGASLAIFLHWRELAVKAGGLDLDALEMDIFDLATCVPGSVLIDALWLLGFTAGFETFASAYYERLPGVHPFAATRKKHQAIPLSWPSTNPPASAIKEEPKPSGESDGNPQTDEQEKSESEETGTPKNAEQAEPSPIPKPADKPKDSPADSSPETTPTPTPEPEATKAKKSVVTKKKAATKKKAPAKKRAKAKKKQNDGDEPRLL
jgi:hypothetical protein